MKNNTYTFQAYDFESADPLTRFLNESLKPLFAKSVYGKRLGKMHFQGDETVLDFGCGNGVSTRWLATELPRGRIIGVDTSKFWLNLAHKRLVAFSNVELYAVDIAAVPLPPKLDAVTIFHVIHDIPPEQRTAIFKTVVERVRPGGSLLIWEPTRPSHGMPVSEIHNLAETNNFELIKKEQKKSSFLGIFQRKNITKSHK